MSTTRVRSAVHVLLALQLAGGLSSAAVPQGEDEIAERPVVASRLAEEPTPRSPAPADSTYSCVRTVTPVTVDGDLGDWIGAHWVEQAYAVLPERDLSVRWALMWDEDGLYSAAEVVDDSLWASPQAIDALEGDAVAIYLQSAGVGRQVLMAKAAEGKQRVLRQTSETVYEAFTAWESLDPVTPFRARKARLNVAITDNDGERWHGGWSYMSHLRPAGGTIRKGMVSWVRGVSPVDFRRNTGTLVFGSSPAPADTLDAWEVGPANEAFAPVSARLSVQLHPDRHALSAHGEVVLVQQEAHPGDTVLLEMELNAALTSVTANGAPVTELVANEPIVHRLKTRTPGLGGRLTLSIAYEGEFHGEVSNRIDPDHSWLLQESRWLPVFADMADPLPLDLEITVPAPQIAVTACDPLEVVEAGSTKTFRFALPDLPAALVVGSYEQVSDRGSPPIEVFCFPGHSEGAQRVATRTREIARFYTDRFGALGHGVFRIAETERRGGYGSQPVLLTTGNFGKKPNLELLAHEMAHLWFSGDGAHVGPLSEGIAVYLSGIYLRDGHGEALPFGQWRRQGTRSESLLEARHDRSVRYFKAACVWRMLADLIGEDTLLDALGVYFRKYAGSGGLADLEGTISQHAGQNLEWFFDQWVRGAGLPDYEIGAVDLQEGEAGYLVSATVTNLGEATARTPVRLAMGKTQRDTAAVIPPGQKWRIQWQTSDRPEKIVVDPDRVILEHRRHNNVALLSGEPQEGHVASKKQFVPPEGGSDQEVLDAMARAAASCDIVSQDDAGIAFFKGTGSYPSGPPSHEYEETPERPPGLVARLYFWLYPHLLKSESSIVVGEYAGLQWAEVRIPLRVGSGQAAFLFVRRHGGWHLINGDWSAGTWVE